jgi:hypothetical protein
MRLFDLVPANFEVPGRDEGEAGKSARSFFLGLKSFNYIKTGDRLQSDSIASAIRSGK